MVLLWVWGLVTAVALMIEFLKGNLIAIWFASGGFVTLLVLALAPKIALVWQVVIFAVVSVMLLVCVRRLCVRALNNNNDNK